MAEVREVPAVVLEALEEVQAVLEVTVARVVRAEVPAAQEAHAPAGDIARSWADGDTDPLPHPTDTAVVAAACCRSSAWLPSPSLRS